MRSVTIEQLGTVVPVRKGTILDATLAAGVPFPHSCRVGECGTCKSRLVAGEVHSLEPADPSVLSPSERADGIILPCRCLPRTDVTVAWLADTDLASPAPVRRATTTVVGLEDSTHDIKRLLLEVDGPPLAFEPGQFCLLYFADLPGRSYSMANRPDEPMLEFHVRRMPEGQASRYVAERLRLGDTVHLEGPFGTATLKRSHPGPIVVAAGGSGLAPIRSIVRSALAGRSGQPIHLYFGVRDERDIYCESELQELTAAHPNFRFEIVVSTPDVKERRTGYVHDAIAADFPYLAGTKLYIAGPPPMVEAVTAVAKSHGVETNDIHADAFTAAVPPESSCSLFQRLRRLLHL